MSWIEEKPPINSPFVFYQKEWMSIYDFISLAGMNPERLLKNSLDMIFFNSSIYTGETYAFKITALHYDDSIWITKMCRWDSPPISGTKNYLTTLEKISVELPEYAHYIGECNGYEQLTHRTLRVVLGHLHNFRTLAFYQS